MAFVLIIVMKISCELYSFKISIQSSIFTNEKLPTYYSIDMTIDTIIIFWRFDYELL